LVRLFEIESPDIESVTNYYSGELVKFVGNILQIVSKSIFILHDNIINIFTKGFLDLPIKILKSDLKDYAQFEDRHILAKNTHQISLFTKGILMMEKTLMGVIEVDPKNILEDGVRKELLNLLAANFNKYIDFTAGYNIDLNLKLTDLAKRISCIKRSFLYIQDYININGSRMWYEEMHRMIYYYVDLEANKFLSKKLKLDIKYDTSKYPIPRFPPLYKDFESYTFIGRLVKYLINVTKPKVSLYYPSTFTWYDAYSKEIISMKTFNLIKQSIGIEGIQGLNKLFSYSIYHQIHLLKKSYNNFINEKIIHKNMKNLTTLLATPCIIDYSEKDTLKNLTVVFGIFAKSISTTFTPIILNLGHLQIFKMMACHSLKESVEVDSHVMNSQMEALNKINLHILKNFIEFKFNSDESENKNVQANKQNDFKYFKLLCEIFEDFGFTNSSQTLYENLSSLEHLIVILALMTYNEVINAYIIDKKGNITKKYKNDDFDIYYFINGIMVVLHQMGRNNIIFFISFISYLIKQHLVSQYTLKDYKGIFEKNTNIPVNIVLIQFFLQELANSSNIDLKMFEINSHLYYLNKSISYD
jgi:WASH complex subunit strumpellin